MPPRNNGPQQGDVSNMLGAIGGVHAGLGACVHAYGFADTPARAAGAGASKDGRMGWAS